MWGNVVIKSDYDVWLERHLAFMATPTPKFRPQEIRRRALVAIDAGGKDGASMADVHRAIKSAHLPPWLIKLVVDRLVEDGHVHKEIIPTAGRPRVQMWSFRYAPTKELWGMLALSRGVDKDFTRPRWEGKSQENIIRDVLRLINGEELRVRDLEMAAGQLYADASRAMGNELLVGKKGVQLTKGQVKAIFVGMARGYGSKIKINKDGDAFFIQVHAG
jgi:hypothetical protein